MKTLVSHENSQPYVHNSTVEKLVKEEFHSPGTNLKAINNKLPAPAIDAATNPKSVGTVLDAKNIADNPTSMITK